MLIYKKFQLNVKEKFMPKNKKPHKSIIEFYNEIERIHKVFAEWDQNPIKAVYLPTQKNIENDKKNQNKK